MGRLVPLAFLVELPLDLLVLLLLHLVPRGASPETTHVHASATYSRRVDKSGLFFESASRRPLPGASPLLLLLLLLRPAWRGVSSSLP